MTIRVYSTINAGDIEALDTAHGDYSTWPEAMARVAQVAAEVGGLPAGFDITLIGVRAEVIGG